MAKWQKTTFQIGDKGRYEGFFDPKNRWNGFANPYLTKAAADALLEQMKKDRDVSYATFDEDRDFFGFRFEADDKAKPDIYAGLDILVNGERTHVYPIGFFGWTWMENDKGVEVEVILDPDKHPEAETVKK